MPESHSSTMMAPPVAPLERFDAVRAHTLALAAPLSAEDCQLQSMPDASPTKWHLAHTSWFFESFLLKAHLDGYAPFDRGFDFLFNSYYHSVGGMHFRPDRGLISRPSLEVVLAYRQHVDSAMQRLLSSGPPTEVVELLELGLNHEQQHQELLLTDIKHAFSVNPTEPAYQDGYTERQAAGGVDGYVAFPGGIVELGAGDDAFSFDNERPRHRQLLQPFRLARRLVTNGEYREFVRAGGYREPRWWLSDGWALVSAQRWTRPIYWDDDLSSEFTLGGRVELDPDSPVCHLCHYEADAFARWSGARLPTEIEWEYAATSGAGLEQLDDQVWQLTGSAYLPYPGFRPSAGSVGEYNGKFMSGQVVLRGGSFATPAGHARPTYRNYFNPAARWQFTGLRTAKDGE